jgi:gliding motility-associated-like protein
MKKNVFNMKKFVHLNLFLPFLFLCNFAFGQSGFISEDTIISKLGKCGSKADICINSISATQLALAKLSVNGKAYATSNIATCKSDTIYVYDFSTFGTATPPPYNLDSLTINGKFFSGNNILTLQALADSLSKWDNTADWTYNDQTKKMIGGKTSSKYSPMVISTSLIASQTKVGLNIGIESKGVKFSLDEGSYKVLVELPALNQKDSLYIYVVCPKKDIVSKTIKVGDTKLYCIDTNDLPAGKVLSLTNYNPLAPNAPIGLQFAPGNLCFEIKGLKKGKDTLLLVALGQSNIRDTSIYYLNVEGATVVAGSHVYNDNVYEGAKKKYCIPTNTGDSITTVTNLCPTKSGKDVKFTIKNGDACVEYEGLKAGGLDTACIVLTTNKGVKDTTTFYVKVVKDCKDLVKIDSAITYVADCSLKGQICFPEFKPADSLKYSFFADGNIYLDDKVGCSFDTIIAYNYSIMLVNGNLLPPPYTLDSWVINNKKLTGTFNTIQELTTLMNTLDPKGKWALDDAKQLIIGGLPSQKYSPINITNQTFLVESELGFNIGLNAKGLALFFEKGVHQIIINENATGCVDTIKAFVSCIKTDFISEEIEEGTKDTVCLDIKELFSDPTKTVNVKNDTNNKNVDFAVSADKKCIYYTGNKIGKDTAVIVACDKYNYCDTTYIFIDVVKKKPGGSKFIVIKDTIFVGDKDKYCIDTIKYLAAPAKFKDVKIKSSNNFADFNLDAKTYCLDYTGKKATGTDTAFVYFCSTVKCDTFQVIVTVLPKPLPNDVVVDTISVGTTNTACLPANKFPGVDLKKPVSVKNICPSTKNIVTFTIQKDTACKAPNGFGYSITYNGIKIGKDTACVEVTDSAGKKEVLKYVVVVTPRKPYIVNDSLKVGAQKIICLENLKLDFKGGIDSVTNYCPKKSNPKVTFAILGGVGNCASGFAISISGLVEGKDTACFLIKDKLGNKDTATFYIKVLPLKPQPKIVFDTVVVFQTDTYCIDPFVLNLGGVDTVINICAKKSGEKVVFSYNPKGKCTTANGTQGITINYTGAEIGTDTSCWWIKGKNGKSDTIKIIVTVRNPAPSIIKETIEVDGVVVICPDLKEIDGAKLDTIYNFCPAKSGKNTKVEIDPITHCVKFTGLKIGIDTVCIIVKDIFGIVDTTTMIVTVKPKGSTKLIAIDDSGTGPKDKPIAIKLLMNDTYDPADSSKVTIKVIPKANGGKGPNNGVVTSVVKGIATYMPNFGFCGKDTFTYEICIGTKCDTADVFINIACDNDTSKTLVIYTGFSPNGDGQNDVFTIKGITNPILKGNILVIYNRWGNEVYKKTDYDNTFDGTWNGNQQLPDGTYWYVLCLPDKTIKSGYLQIRR